MSSYPIDFSEPLRPGFTIEAGALDGPGGSASHSPLRLYGRGALEWGEAVDENLARLAENFCGASPPPNPIPGQIWMLQRLYYHNSDVGNAYQGWYFYNLTAREWQLVNGTGVVASAATPGQTYYYNSTDGNLYGNYALVKPQAASYVARSFVDRSGVPAATFMPPIEIVQWEVINSSGTGFWKVPAVPFVTYNGQVGAATNRSKAGSMQFDTVSKKLRIYDGGAWVEILGPAATMSNASANMSFAGYRVYGLSTPVANDEPATKGYVDAAVGSGLGYLPLTGGTLTVTSNPGLIINRTNAANNTSMEFRATGGTVFIGYGATGTFSVKGDATLTTSPWFSVGATSAGAIGSFSVGSGLTVNQGGSFGSNLSTGGTFTANGAVGFNSTLTVAGAVTLSSTLNMTTHKILNVATGTDNTDGVNKGQMDAAITSAITGTSLGNVARIIDSGTYKAGDICVVAGKIYIAAGGGTGVAPGGNWKQVFPAVYS